MEGEQLPTLSLLWLAYCIIWCIFNAGCPVIFRRVVLVQDMMYYDGNNSYLFVNGKEILNFKAENKNVNFPTQFCV